MSGIGGGTGRTSSTLFRLLLLTVLLSCHANGNDESASLPTADESASLPTADESAVLPTADESESPKLVCYAELWAGGRPPPGNHDLSTLPADHCDYLVLIYLTLDPNTWSLRMNHGYGKVDPEEIRKATRLRTKMPLMKVLMSVGGWEDGVKKYSDMISERSRRKAFAESVIQVLEKYDLDGLELHWMYPGVVWRGGRSDDKNNFLQLVKELKVIFKPRNWILTASVPPDEATLRGGYNVPKLNSLLHQMHLRTLDMRGAWSGYASGHCPLYASDWEKPELRNLNVNGSLSLWLREGASPQKLLPTFPFFGRSYTLNTLITTPGAPISGPGPQTELLRAPGLMAYFEICDRLKNKRLERSFQSQAETPYATQDDLWVGYDDEESLEKKVKLLTEKNAGGAVVFAVGLDDFAGNCGQSYALLRKIRELLDEGLPDSFNQTS